jgi:nucleoside-diphosphate-sugar epimerase
MPKTLLTGANGFVAAHLLDQLIAEGHHVTGSVRSISKGEQILATHPEYAGKVDFVVVADYAAEGTWDEAFKNGDFDYVVHSAAPLLDDPGNTDFERDFLRPSVSGWVSDTSFPKACWLSIHGRL